MTIQSWRSNWERVTPFWAFPREIRKATYTTNDIESLNSMLRRVIKTRGHFPNDTAAVKLLYLGLKNAQKKWTRSLQGWKQALNRECQIFCVTAPEPQAGRASMIGGTPHGNTQRNPGRAAQGLQVA